MSHLAALSDRIERASVGNGSTILISGEAGIGKSRLVHEERTIAIERGIVVLQGNCFEQDRALPFAPFVDLLRKNLTGLEGRLGLDDLAPQLLKLAPDLASNFAAQRVASSAEPEQEKRVTLFKLGYRY